MPSKLSRFCDGIMEAGWLAALILVPLFFNVYSSRIFEPDKITILRSLVLVVIAAWIVKLVELGGGKWERIEPGTSPVKTLLRIPLVLPVLALAVLYLIATVFSISPSTSLWGSYQRLQGTYTTLSYLVIFAAVAVNLRKRSQVERIITVIIMVSLPITLYGVLQKYKLDPVPWGGDTSIRIAANMGNSIFVAAYVIMVFPLTVGRIVESFKTILIEEEKIIQPMVKATVYIFIAALQLIALYMSGSRGPALGWIASSFFLFLLLSLYWGKRWLTIATVGVAAAFAVFLVVFNIQGGPLEGLRQSPAIGRFGRLMDAESNSALVRKYIWEGAADLVSIHAPLEFPDGGIDRFNFLRPLIGYGPESMYVAYNPFYIPELAQVEKRNASPDRSHNETWDSLVITGAAGIIIYLAIFLSGFYYGLKWVGLVPDKKQRALFFGLILSGGLIGAVVMSVWRGVEYFGVGMPFGMLIGLLLYITEVAIFSQYQMPTNPGEAVRSLILIVLLAGIIAHFVEINFGIAIAVTRTYFWTFSALLLCVGYILPLYNQFDLASVSGNQSEDIQAAASRSGRSGSSGKKRRSRGGTSPTTAFSSDLKDYMLPALLLSIVMVTMAYDYISNPRGVQSTLGIIVGALTQLPNKNYAVSYGVLALILTTWVLLGTILTAETRKYENISTWLPVLGLTLFISGVVSLIYWLWQAGTLAAMARTTASDLDQVLQQVGRFEYLLAGFYLFIFLILIALGFLLPESSPGRLRRFSVAGAVTAAASLVIVLLLSAYTNLRVVQADIAFKLAEPFTRSGQWPVAIAIYNRANKLAPTEDYYYLFLGRAYLEHAKTLQNPEEREALISQAAADLKKAQSINPLNTDHTANLARLNSLWASYAISADEKAEKAQDSDYYFSRAVMLSPNNARIWDEWALLYLNILGDPEAGVERLEHALSIDPRYHWTYALLADYYNRNSRKLEDPQQQSEELAKAADYYSRALELPTPGEPAASYSYAISLAGIESQLGNISGAIEAYQRALKSAPQDAELWRIEEALGTLNAQTGDLEAALIHYQNALSSAPEDQKDRLINIINQITQY